MNSNGPSKPRSIVGELVGEIIPSQFASAPRPFRGGATEIVGTYRGPVRGGPVTMEVSQNVANPDGTLLAYQPYGEEGILIGDIDVTKATGLLARRYKPIS